MQAVKVTLTTVAAALMLASCQPKPVDTVAWPTVSAPTIVQHAWQSCADKYPNPTDGICEAYDRAAVAHGLIRTEDGSYVPSSYYDHAALGAL